MSILYDSVLTPRSSIVPSAINRIDLSAKLMPNGALERLNLVNQVNQVKQIDENCRSSAASDSDQFCADSGKGESDQDTQIGPTHALGPKCSRQCLRFGKNFFQIKKI